MIKFIKRNTFPAIIALSAISVSGSAAFYSVYGLSKLFAGAQFEVIIMAGSLEVAKLVIASLLYQYWDTINKILRVYLTVAAFILVLITSMGIYGFLSAAYQDTYKSLIENKNKIEFLENKANFYENDVTRFDKELQQIMDNISTLSNAKSRSIQVKDTSVAGGIRNTISTVDLRLAQDRLRIEEDKRKDVYLKRTVAADSLQKYKLEILQLQNSSDTTSELGPLKYLAGLTGISMDKIINILLLVIIFVFDPLAVSLVIAANMAFATAFPPREENLYGETDEDDWDDFIPDEDEEDLTELQKTLLMDLEGEEEEEVEPTPEPTPIPVIKKPVKAEPSGTLDDLKNNPNAFQIVNKDGSREFLKEEPRIDIRGTRAYIRLNDGREGWMDRDNSDRIIYM